MPAPTPHQPTHAATPGGRAVAIEPGPGGKPWTREGRTAYVLLLLALTLIVVLTLLWASRRFRAHSTARRARNRHARLQSAWHEAGRRMPTPPPGVHEPRPGDSEPFQ